MYILGDYDRLLEKILNEGIETPNRTGTNALFLPAVQCGYDISKFFPLSTKRKIYPKSILGELFWMLSGSTNVNDLNTKFNSKIWDFWKDPEFEKRNGYDDGEFGPIYGFQLRHFGGDYSKRHTDPEGFDQVSYIINELKINKYSRRIMINLWDPNVMTTDKVKLPCCHYNLNLVVDNQNRLTGVLNSRSCDVPVGGIANILFYGAFLYMIAQQTNLQPYKLVHNITNAHIYVDQINATKEYLSRPEITSPRLILNKAKDIFSYSVDDFVFEDYNPAAPIKFPVAV